MSRQAKWQVLTEQDCQTQYLYPKPTIRIMTIAELRRWKGAIHQDRERRQCLQEDLQPCSRHQT